MVGYIYPCGQQQQNIKFTVPPPILESENNQLILYATKVSCIRQTDVFNQIVMFQWILDGQKFSGTKSQKQRFRFAGFWIKKFMKGKQLNIKHIFMTLISFYYKSESNEKGKSFVSREDGSGGKHLLFWGFLCFQQKRLLKYEVLNTHTTATAIEY